MGEKLAPLIGWSYGQGISQAREFGPFTLGHRVRTSTYPTIWEDTVKPREEQCAEGTEGKEWGLVSVAEVRVEF